MKTAEAQSYEGTSFEELLAPVDREPFRRFMDAQHASFTPCLRVSVEREHDVIGVDLFHAKMPHVFGGVCHLLALREDSEFRPAPEAVEGPRHCVKPSKGGAPSSCSSTSQMSANSMLTSTELQDMTLLVDPDTPFLATCRNSGFSSTIFAYTYHILQV